MHLICGNDIIHTGVRLNISLLLHNEEKTGVLHSSFRLLGDHFTDYVTVEAFMS